MAPAQNTASTDFRPAVGIVGAGRYGITLAEVAARNNRDVVLYTSLDDRAETLRKTRRLPTITPELEHLSDRVDVTTDPSVLASRCTLIMMPVSREHVGRNLQNISGVLDGAHFLVHAVHLLHEQTLDRFSQILRRHSCVRQIGVIAGPVHVAEILSGKPNAAVVGSHFPSVIRSVQRALGAPNFHIFGNDDMRGVELAAALGQVVTVAVGLADGLNMGAATRSILITRGLNEIATVGRRLGAAEKTFFGLAGIGRLVDALRRGEPNYQFGFDLAGAADVVQFVDGAPPEAQGIPVVRQLVEYGRSTGLDLRITNALDAVMAGQLDPEAGIRNALASDTFDE